MCGIVGFTGKNPDKVVLMNMMDLIEHRGPDGSGVYTNNEVALGHRRLSIIDHEGGMQPMRDSDKEITIVFNGEIYNHGDIRLELEQNGRIFQTDHSDTEVLIHGYKEWGLDGLLNKLRGMFAFVIWDARTNELVCARDHFGIKPMYYYVTEAGEFMFSSEIKSFLAHPEFKKELNESQLQLYLSYQYSPGEDTFFKGVKKLLPGCSLIVKNGKMDIQRYWEPTLESDGDKSLQEWSDEINEVMAESVKVHECSDTEVGSFLSSGIDSSYIVALSDVDKTFTAGFDDEKYDESGYAKEFSKRVNIENITKKISVDEYWKEFPQIQYHMDEPLADAASVAFYFVNQEAAKHVKVCLSGEGADELFAGYNTYNEAFRLLGYNKIPECVRGIIGEIAKKLPDFNRKSFFIRRAKNISNRYFGHTEIFTNKQISRVLKKYDKSIDPFNLVKDHVTQLVNQHDVNKMQSVDLRMWLAGDILLKADKMSMASSLELRVPFLDVKVFETAKKIPVKHKVNAVKTKIALRMAASEKLPEANANKKKLGFPVPVRAWLREEKYVTYIRNYFNSDIAEQYFDTQYLNKMLSDHASSKRDNWRQIWCIFTFIIWYDEYFVKR